MVRWEETGLHHQSAEVHSLQIDKLPFQEGTSLAPSEYKHTQDIKDLCREVLLVHISEIQEVDDDSLDRVNLDDFHFDDFDENLFDNMDTGPVIMTKIKTTINHDPPSLDHV